MTSNTLLTTYDRAGETVTNTNPDDSFATPNPSQKHPRSYNSMNSMRRIKDSPNSPSRFRDVESLDAFTTPNRPTKPPTLNAPPRHPRSRYVKRENGFTTPTRQPPSSNVESDGDSCDVESKSEENVDLCTTPKRRREHSIPNAPRKLGGIGSLTRQNAMDDDPFPGGHPVLMRQNATLH